MEAVVLEAILMVLGVKLVKPPISIMDLRTVKLAGMRSRETHNLEASNLRSSRGGVVVQKAGATNNSSINNIIATGDLNEFTKKKISKLTTEINSRGIVVVVAAQILRILVIW